MELTVGSFVELVLADTVEIESDRNRMNLMKKAILFILKLKKIKEVEIYFSWAFPCDLNVLSRGSKIVRLL